MTDEPRPDRLRDRVVLRAEVRGRPVEPWPSRSPTRTPRAARSTPPSGVRPSRRRDVTNRLRPLEALGRRARHCTTFTAPASLPRSTFRPSTSRAERRDGLVAAFGTAAARSRRPACRVHQHGQLPGTVDHHCRVPAANCSSTSALRPVELTSPPWGDRTVADHAGFEERERLDA